MRISTSTGRPHSDMKRPFKLRIVLVCVVIIVWSFAGLVGARAASAVPERTMLVGDSVVVECRNLTRVAISDPDTADISVPSSTELMIVAKTPGKTTLYIWDAAGRRSVTIAVEDAKLDMAKLIADVTRQIDDNRITARGVGNTVILEGTVASEAESARAGAIAEAVAEVTVFRGSTSGGKDTEVKTTSMPAGESFILEKVATQKEQSVGSRYGSRVPKIVNIIRIGKAFGEISVRTLETASAIKQALNNPSLTVQSFPGSVIIIDGIVGTQAEVDHVSLLLKGWSKEGKDDKGVSPSGENVETVTMVNAVTINTSIARQILLRVQVVDVNRDNTKDLGLEWGDLLDNHTVLDQPFIIGQLLLGPTKIENTQHILKNPIGARIMALEEQKKAKTLAKPNLLVLDGKEGTILVGGEIPVPVVQGGAGGGITIEWKPFGVRLTFQPVITGKDNIQLKLMPEVSTLDFANAVTLSGFQIPAMRTRRAETTVNVIDGQSLAIGGLLQSDTSKVVRKIPLLGDLPIIGELFRTRSWTKSETELVIVITPEIVEPTATASATP